jgi:hypothetical protein
MPRIIDARSRRHGSKMRRTLTPIRAGGNAHFSFSRRARQLAIGVGFDRPESAAD